MTHTTVRVACEGQARADLEQRRKRDEPRVGACEPVAELVEARKRDHGPHDQGGEDADLHQAAASMP